MLEPLELFANTVQSGLSAVFQAVLVVRTVQALINSMKSASLKKVAAATGAFEAARFVPCKSFVVFRGVQLELFVILVIVSEVKLGFFV